MLIYTCATVDQIFVNDDNWKAFLFYAAGLTSDVHGECENWTVLLLELRLSS